jgi:spermidine synthase
VPPQSYRSVIYLGTFLSGAAALVFQVAWNRYLAFLVGSEARSISLVVAVFLLGLAAGYRFWGDWARRLTTRAAQLKALGFIELAIAAYALLFPRYFGLVRDLAFRGPDSLAMDLLWSALLLFAPTFLMGASIPILTAAVPGDPEEVNFCHSRIYGLNTLGAFLGALLAGLWLVPAIGLPATLILGAVVEAAVGLVFVLNRLPGRAHQAADIPRIPNRFGSAGIYLLVFTTGAVSVGLEVVFTRVTALTIGPGQYVFPIVVSVVILGLAIGSLSLRRRTLTAAAVPRELVTAAAVLAVLYLTVPYWPYWVSHIHVSLSPIPTNFGVYLFFVVLFVALMLLPLAIPMGRLLPLGYALLDKTRDDYGPRCGRVYFCNTLGTVAGAIGIGYLLFLVLSLPQILKVNLALLLVLAAALLARIPRRNAAIACLAAAAGAFLLPGWNRIGHINCMYRHGSVQDFHFRGLFRLPAQDEALEVLMLRDDPGATVAAYAVTVEDPDSGGTVVARTIAVNVKPDANTIGDYSNMVLSGMVPWLYAPRAAGLRAAVVGLGAGLTSGALAAMPDVESVTTLEISPGVIEAAPFFDPDTFGLSSNPRSRIVETDAFRFFARSDEKFDIIVSEPSNPWVAGVENLFTPEYYALAGAALAEDGLLFQWVQRYASTEEIFGAICANVTAAFPHVALFVIGANDVGILASRAPLAAPHLERRLGQAAAQRALAPIGLDDPDLLSIMLLYGTPQMRAMASAVTRPAHSVEVPWIGHAAARAAFTQELFEPPSPILAGVGRHLPASARRRAAFERWMGRHAADLSPWCAPVPGRHSAGFLCTRLQSLAADLARVRAPAAVDQMSALLDGYGRLRVEGFLAADVPLLGAVKDALLAQAAARPGDAALKGAARRLVQQLAFEWEWDQARSALDALAAAAALGSRDAAQVREEIEAYQRSALEWARRNPELLAGPG